MIPVGWRRDTTAVIHDDDTSSSLTYIPAERPTPQEPDHTSNRRPEWWTPPQPKREKRPLAVRLWQARQRAAKKLARTNERRERRSRA